MRKANKIIMATVSTLLTLILVSSCILSGLYAKYVTKESSLVTVGFKKFGVTITHGTDLNTQYDTSARDGIVEIKVNTGESKLIAPGTRGALAYFEVMSTDVTSPGLPWYIDIDGEISIGDGYKASSGLILNENGKPIDYFPIIIYLYRYDWNPTGGEDGKGAYEKSTVKPVQVAHSVCRLTPNAPKGMTTVLDDDTDDSWDGKYRMSLTSENRSFDVEQLQNELNADTGTISLNGAFDDKGDNNTGNAAGTKSIFVVEWCWPYKNDMETDVDYKKESEANNKKTTGVSGEYYYYQTPELDAQIGEAMIKSPELFNISLDLSAKVSQATGQRPQ